MQTSLPSSPQDASSTLRNRDSRCPSALFGSQSEQTFKSSEFHQSSWAFEQKRTHRLPYLFEGREAFFPGEARLRCGTSSLHPPCWEGIFGILSAKGETVTQALRCTRKEEPGCLCHGEASSAAAQSREAEPAAPF